MLPRVEGRRESRKSESHVAPGVPEKMAAPTKNLDDKGRAHNVDQQNEAYV